MITIEQLQDLFIQNNFEYTFRNDECCLEDVANLKHILSELSLITTASDYYEAKERIINAEKLIKITEKDFENKMLSLKEKYFGYIQAKENDLLKIDNPAHIDLCKFQLQDKLIKKYKKYALDHPDIETKELNEAQITGLIEGLRVDEEIKTVKDKMDKEYVNDYIFQSNILFVSLFSSCQENNDLSTNKKNFFQKAKELGVTIATKTIDAGKSIKNSIEHLAHTSWNIRSFADMLKETKKNVTQIIQDLLQNGFKSQQDSCISYSNQLAKLVSNYLIFFEKELKKLDEIIESNKDVITKDNSSHDLIKYKSHYENILSKICEEK